MPEASEKTAASEFARLQDQVLEWYGVEATERYLELDRPEMRAHVLEAGAGEPVLFLHGGGDEAMIWAPLLARMQGAFSLYAPDRPGCGLSDRFLYDDVDLPGHAADFVFSVLDALEIDRTDVVACSAGGFFAFAAALARPERFRRLVFAGYPLGILDHVPLNLRLVAGVPGFGTLFKLLNAGIDDERVRKLYAEEFNADLSTFPDVYFEAKAASFRLPGSLDSFISFIKRAGGLGGLSPQASLVDEVSLLRVPSLVLWGERDLAPPAAGREAVAPIPNSTFEVVEGSGHFPFHDVPDETADRIVQFLSAPDPAVEEERDKTL